VPLGSGMSFVSVSFWSGSNSRGLSLQCSLPSHPQVWQEQSENCNQDALLSCIASLGTERYLEWTPRPFLKDSQPELATRIRGIDTLHTIVPRADAEVGPPESPNLIFRD